MVILGHSYLFVTMSRAAAAHSSPRKKAGEVFNLGWFENRADMAHTERMRTGGKVPALEDCQRVPIALNMMGSNTYLNFLM